MIGEVHWLWQPRENHWCREGGPGFRDFLVGSAEQHVVNHARWGFVRKPGILGAPRAERLACEGGTA